MPKRNRVCARCGAKLGKDQPFVYSRFTKSFYCTGAQYEAACEKRRIKLEKEREKEKSL